MAYSWPLGEIMKIHCRYSDLVHISELKPHPKNRNKHPKKQIEAMAKIIRYQGWRRPVTVSNRSGFMTVGHGRVLVAALLHAQYPDEGWERIPVDRQEYESEEQEYADVQADNAIALWAQLDIPAIKLDVKDFPALKLNLLGIEKLQTVDAHTRGEGPDATEPKDPIAKRGDLWILGDHRIYCGDSTSMTDVSKLVGPDGIDMVFTSPPYNVGIKYNGFDDVQGEAEYMAMMTAVVRNCYAVMKSGRMIAWNVGVSPKSKPHHHGILLEQAGFDLYRHIVWKKAGGGNIPLWSHSKKKPVARNYQPNYGHELVYLMSKGAVEHGAPTDMPDELGMDVWDVSQFGAGGNNHPAASPVHLAQMAIDVMSAPGEVAFEPFGGSGSTMIACEKSGRRCYSMEIDPHYVDVAIHRWEKFTGKRAEKVGSNG
jgi:DNA modification methylase